MTAEIIQMTARRQPITPNRRTFEHAGQRYTCVFDPNAPIGEQWVWIVEYVRITRYSGSSPTMEAASVKARKQIHTLNRWGIAQEEDDVANS